ncbi:MAG: hypothetical protein HN742_18230 [Lentisphaerae bacterium]|jgi:protein arginine kinase activator|nr:hypothetical protein [Lentisphaerota bacterium]MBT4818505.1 hypothetical protein [Lentisphaerota bacterium]MBT5611843.1 hypothetical protein [Lentisphaerota bacterium]MBT7059300.1 hypothetical protein [Lentisphaerota bacterium]MBT7843823.1 hypothetical protein [Lentisphaerota bacterium]
MHCDVCHQAQASIIIQKVVGQSEQTLHLCPQCAAQKHVLPAGTEGLDLPGLFSKLSADAFGPGNGTGDGAEEREVLQRCDVCGLTDLEFQQSGRLGCPSCYTAFEDELQATLVNMHRGAIHTGRIPGEPNVPEFVFAPESSLPALQRELDRAVASEAYERAAALRDEIRTLLKAQGGHVTT